MGFLACLDYVFPSEEMISEEGMASPRPLLEIAVLGFYSKFHWSMHALLSSYPFNFFFLSADYHYKKKE